MRAFKEIKKILMIAFPMVLFAWGMDMFNFMVDANFRFYQQNCLDMGQENCFVRILNDGGYKDVLLDRYIGFGFSTYKTEFDDLYGKDVVFKHIFPWKIVHRSEIVQDLYINYDPRWYGMSAYYKVGENFIHIERSNPKYASLMYLFPFGTTLLANYWDNNKSFDKIPKITEVKFNQ